MGDLWSLSGLYYASESTVYTDNNPPTYILSSAKLSATGLRWVKELADLYFTIKYRPGKVNTDTDELSRLLPDVDNYLDSCTESVTFGTLQAMKSSILGLREGNINWITALTMSLNVLEKTLNKSKVPPLNTISCDEIALPKEKMQRSANWSDGLSQKRDAL